MGAEGIFLGEDHKPSLTPTQRAWDILTPDFVSRRNTITKRIGPTSWLDGLRGWAALCVVIMHITVYTHDGIELCYGSKFHHNDNHNNSLIALPIIRLPFTGGHFAVMLFFAISGYVIPRRMLQLLSEKRKQEFYEAFQSAIIRRPVRLFLPVFTSTIVVFLAWHLLNINPPDRLRQPNLILELWAWTRETLLFSYFYRFGWLYTNYNPQTWTIMVEWRGSMFVFVYLMMVHSLPTRLRAQITAFMTVYLSVLTPGAWYACFFAGMCLSELEIIDHSNEKIELPWDKIDRWFRARPQVRKIMLHTSLLIGLYLATQPSADFSTRLETYGECPGWRTLGWMIPLCYFDADAQYRWFWLFWAAFIILYVVREISWLRKSFESNTAQYLGKHSFALYLVHGPMILIFAEQLFFMTGVKKMWTEEHKKYAFWADMLVKQPWWPLPEGGPFGLEPNFIFCLVVCLPVFMYVAEIGTRLFDEPSSQASNWLWKKVKSVSWT